VGFKNSGTVFADAYASSLTGAVSKVQIGIGSAVQAVRQTFNQGNITTTNNPLDMAVNGNGFFQVQLQNGGFALTRNGQFNVDVKGNIVTQLGDKLMGYQIVDSNTGNVTMPEKPNSTHYRDLVIPTKGVGASPTNEISLSLNLSADAEAIAKPALPADPIDVDKSETYTYSTATKIFDSAGKEHTLSYYFVRRSDVVDPAATPPAYSQWEVYTVLDNRPSTMDLNATINFDGAGKIFSVAPELGTITVDGEVVNAPTNGALLDLTFDTPRDVDPSLISIEYGTITQYGGQSIPREITQNGSPQGEIAGLSISRNGVIQARYTNGVSKDIGMVGLTTVRNNNGLSPIGNNYWVETPESGSLTPGEPGAGLNGVISAGQVEESNVDLTQELVQMIIQQRNYQANAQSIRTQDQILQTLVNLR